mmetsp:Transcript_122997/g.229815  ORF Transcript_122997/g.229815 Transcript_122997/m.229815 type:complete len:215 (-) Transcript_122997:345-989(-)
MPENRRPGPVLRALSPAPDAPSPSQLRGSASTAPPLARYDQIAPKGASRARSQPTQRDPERMLEDASGQSRETSFPALALSAPESRRPSRNLQLPLAAYILGVVALLIHHLLARPACSHLVCSRRWPTQLKMPSSGTSGLWAATQQHPGHGSWKVKWWYCPQLPSQESAWQCPAFPELGSARRSALRAIACQLHLLRPWLVSWIASQDWYWSWH